LSRLIIRFECAPGAEQKLLIRNNPDRPEIASAETALLSGTMMPLHIGVICYWTMAQIRNRALPHSVKTDASNRAHKIGHPKIANPSFVCVDAFVHLFGYR
jgi:hypothetical protein